MAPGVSMPAPKCLIENRNRELVVCQDALRLLSEIEQPVVVVAIVGLYRTGKSYLMNKLAGKNKGFPLGSTIQANTKGIWMWCIPHPSRPNQTLVLLDTEGLGDVEKGDNQNDSWIFALAVLLSCTFVYNSLGTIDQQAMDQLHYVTELTEQIKAKSSFGDEDSSEFVRFFPTFVWALRDFTLQLELNGEPIREDAYLENALKLKKGNSDDTEKHNLPRKCIRTFFPRRKCFAFDRPASKKNLPKLESMEEGELEPDFVEQAAQFCRYIFQSSEPKTIPGGHIVNGRMLANLLVTYVDTIRSGKVPCMENAVLALAKIENTGAVSDAVARYVELMEERLKLPTETVQELLGVHAACEEDALQVFMARAFKDDDHKFQVEFMKILNQKREEYCKKNEDASSQRCQELLESLSQELEINIKNGIYSQPGGHKQFVNDLKTMEQQYHQAPNKGVMAREVLEKFLKDKEATGKTILQSDEALTQKEKEMAEATVRAEAAEREREMQRQQQVILEQKIEDQQRSYETNLQQLQQKMELEREKMLLEQERVINAKLEEQKKLLQEGFQKEANKMSAQIQDLKNQAAKVKKPSFWERLTDTFVGAVSTALPGFVGKGLNAVVSLFKRGK